MYTDDEGIQLKKYYIDLIIGIEAENKIKASQFIDQLLLENTGVADYAIEEIMEVEVFDND